MQNLNLHKAQSYANEARARNKQPCTCERCKAAEAAPAIENIINARISRTTTTNNTGAVRIFYGD